MRHNNFTLEVIVNDKPVYEYQHQGDIYIEGRKNSSFKLRFSNTTGKKVLVVPSVDGLSTLDGNVAGPDSPGLIVPAYGKIDIPGWMVDTSKSAEFVFQDRESSYAKSVDVNTTNTGVIGVLVFDEVQKQPQVHHVVNTHIHYPPNVRRVSPYTPWDNNIVWVSNTSDASSSNIGMTADATASFGTATTSGVDPSENLGVGWGNSVDFNVKSTTFDKGDNIAQLVVFYDSRKNLERRGIVVERRDTLSIRPNPFPGVGCKPPAGWKP
jgi:hypothetical protein